MVRSTKDLRLEIEYLKAHANDAKSGYYKGLVMVLDLLDSFEAGWRERLKICDDLVEQLKRDGEKWEYHPARVEALALRRVLDGSEEG